MNKRRNRQPARQALAERLRAECLRRGWSVAELAKRTGVSRTTIHQLGRGTTRRPHLETLRKVAAALELPIAALLNPDSFAPGPASASRRTDPRRRRADAATNPAVAEVLRERPQLVEGWSQDEIEELHSLVGAGGALIPRGVELAAEAINRRRETIHKLQIVLETELREEAIKFVDLLYRMVQPPRRRGPVSAPDDDSA